MANPRLWPNRAWPTALARLGAWIGALRVGPAARRRMSGDPPARSARIDGHTTALRAIGPAADPSSGARVFLVGAGPGAADLLTLRAAKLLRAADVVVHDRLVSAEVLELVRPEAALIDVGKRRGHHRLAQPQINALLVQLAGERRCVVRLKGGDPFVFARGGEEAEALARAGVSFEVVPGITAATACAASAGIPLTHRDHASGCTFVTGHSRDGVPDLDWPALATSADTLVVYMGLHTVAAIASQLIRHGRDANTPAAVIERGGTERQRVVSAPLEELPSKIAASGIDGPALIVIGEVVRLRALLSRELAEQTSSEPRTASAA